MDQDAIDRLNARSPNAGAYLKGGRSANETMIDRALGCVSDMASADARGDVVMVGEHRRTLDDICASLDGYPAPVRDALAAAGLRSTPRIAQR
jgi:hypothetical protein